MAIVHVEHNDIVAAAAAAVVAVDFFVILVGIVVPDGRAEGLERRTQVAYRDLTRRVEVVFVAVHHVASVVAGGHRFVEQLVGQQRVDILTQLC